MDLVNQDIKSDTLNMFKELNNGKIKKLSQQAENTNKEVSIIKKNRNSGIEKYSN